MDGGAACVAAGGADDVQLAAVAFEQIFKEISKQLECNVFKGQCRAVEEFADEDFSDLFDGNDIVRLERRVAFGDKLFEIVIGDGVSDERPHDFASQFRIGERPPAVQCIFLNGRYLRRNEKTTVIGEPHHDSLCEINGSDAAPRADIA